MTSAPLPPGYSRHWPNATRADPRLVWLAVLASAVIPIPLWLPELNLLVQASAFDFLLPAITLWGLRRGWWALPPRRVLWNTLVIAAALAGHAMAVAATRETVLLVPLAKETIKLVAIVGLFTCLLVVFGNGRLREPPSRIVVIVLVPAVIAAVLASEFEPFAVTRTVYAVCLAGLVFLLCLDGAWLVSAGRRAALLAANLIVALACIGLHNKGVAGTMMAMFAWLICAGSISLRGFRQAVLASLALVLLFAAGVGLSALAGASLDFLWNMSTVERSIEIRLLLWQTAVQGLIDTFPIGLGAGQFAEVARAVPQLALERHEYAHNSLLTLAAELGLLGLLLAAGLAAVVVKAAKGWRAPLVPLFLALVVPPLLIHDGHTIRVLLIATALGLSLATARAAAGSRKADAAPVPAGATDA